LSNVKGKWQAGFRQSFLGWICEAADSPRKGCGIPHLAKNERDVGHPAICAEMEPKSAGQLLSNFVVVKQKRSER
jgi:hypothetical protein